MSFLRTMDISGSGLTAERLRLDLISDNIANINTTRTGRTTAGGNQIPYQRQVPVFQARQTEKPFGSFLALASSGDGVRVAGLVKDPTPFKEVYNPEHPDAIQKPEAGLQPGYVRLPNVELVNEMVDLISASRAYEANVTALNSGKSMALKALEIGKV